MCLPPWALKAEIQQVLISPSLFPLAGKKKVSLSELLQNTYLEKPRLEKTVSTGKLLQSEI